MTLWRLRVHVQDERGRLASLASTVASWGGNILGLSVHGCDESCVVDELVVDLPSSVRGPHLAAATAEVGCGEVHLTRAAPTSLVDEVTRALHLVAGVQHEPGSVVPALVALLEADSATLLPPGRTLGATRVTAGQRDHALTLPLPGGQGAVVLRRGWAPFTVTEVARAQAMLQVANAASPGPVPLPAQR